MLLKNIQNGKQTNATENLTSFAKALEVNFIGHFEELMNRFYEVNEALRIFFDSCCQT